MLAILERIRAAIAAKLAAARAIIGAGLTPTPEPEPTPTTPEVTP